MVLVGGTGVLGEKHFTVPLCAPQISHGPGLGSNPGHRGDTPASTRVPWDICRGLTRTSQ
jgi:hypothetical protein